MFLAGVLRLLLGLQHKEPHVSSNVSHRPEEALIKNDKTGRGKDGLEGGEGV